MKKEKIREVSKKEQKKLYITEFFMVVLASVLKKVTTTIHIRTARIKEKNNVKRLESNRF